MDAIGYWVAGAVVGISLLLLVLRSFNALVYGRRERLPPGTMGWPLVGESAELAADFALRGNSDGFVDGFVNSRIAKFGKLTSYKTHLFGGPKILFPTVEGIKLVLSSNELFRFGFPTSSQVMGVQFFSLYTGARWRRFREILMESLSGPVALNNAIPIMDRHTKRLLDEAASKESVDMFEVVEAVTRASEMEILFGPCDQEALDLFANGAHTFLKGILFGLPINFPGFARYKSIKARLEIQGWLQARIDQKRAAKKDCADTMGYMMSTVDETGKKLPDDVITCNMFHFFVGSQSTARPLFWVLLYLAKNPQFIPELREEHQAMAATKKPGEILTKDDIRKLPFTKKVLDESLRLVNLIPFLFRRATTDVDFHGITVPKGWTALAWTRALHMDPENYPNPETFNPHRWNNPATLAAPFMPFGYGPGRCPGMAQAQLQSSLFLYNLTIKYNWEFKDLNSPVSYIPEPKPANCLGRLSPLKI